MRTCLSGHLVHLYPIMPHHDDVTNLAPPKGPLKVIEEYVAMLPALEVTSKDRAAEAHARCNWYMYGNNLPALVEHCPRPSASHHCASPLYWSDIQCCQPARSQ